MKTLKCFLGKKRRRRRLPKLPPLTLEYQLCELLSGHCGERGFSEGAVDTLARIIAERNRAMTVLALREMRERDGSGHTFSLPTL